MTVLMEVFSNHKNVNRHLKPFDAKIFISIHNCHMYVSFIPGCMVTEMEVAIPPSNVRVIATLPDSSTVYRDWSKCILTSVYVGA